MNGTDKTPVARDRTADALTHLGAGKCIRIGIVVDLADLAA